MHSDLTENQAQLQKEFREFVQAELLPVAGEFDRAGAVPHSFIEKLAAKGYLGATIPEEYGGRGMDQLSYGLLSEAIGRACSSVRSLLTVHLSLTAETIFRWGTNEQRAYWLPLLATGKKLAAFGLSEPETGSDAQNVQSSYTVTANGYRINGHKKWTTFGQLADVFVIVAKSDSGQVSAFLVNRDTPGVRVEPLDGILGTRASMLAEIHLENCEVPADCLLGREGFGFMQIVNTALDNGRYSVACGSLGIARACMEDSIAYSKQRHQFGVPLKDHQLTKQKIANMITQVKAATLLCRNAGYLRDKKSPDAFIQTAVAKYFTTTAANKIAGDAVQLHGALGCHDSLPVERYFRDARIMEIIEGSSEIQQLMIANQGISALGTIV